MKPLKWMTLIAAFSSSLWAGQISGLITSQGAPVKGAKVVLYSGSSAASSPSMGKLDSAQSDSTGFYLLLAGPNSGSNSFLVSLSGYHSTTVGAVTATSTPVTRNFMLNRNDSSSVITGRVLKASDNSPIVKAIVTLSGGSLDVARIDSTDSAGNFTFKNVGIGTTYSVTSNYAGYAQANVASIAVGWNSTATVASMLLIRNLGTLIGVVRRADTTTKTLAGAKIVLSLAGIKVDSTVSDGAGNYSIQINAATFTVTASLAGYRGYKGNYTLDTTATVYFGTSTVLNIFLTPATGSMFGLVVHAAVANPPIAAGGIDSAKVYLERRRSTAAGFNTWTLCDSTLTDVTGYYSFSGIIPATAGLTGTTGTTVPVYGVSYTGPNGSYRLQIRPLKGATGGIKWAPNYDTNAVLTSMTSTTVYTVAFTPNSTTNIANITLTLGAVPGAIYQSLQGNSHNVRFSKIGKQLALELAPSTFPRVIQVFDLKGTLQKSLLVKANESQVTIPADFSPEKGFIFALK